MRKNTKFEWIFVMLAVVLSFGCVATANEKVSAMSSEKTCEEGAFSRSRCMVEAALDDLAMSYDFLMNGGVTSISQTSPGTYVFRIPEEERVDELTYKLEISDGAAVILAGGLRHVTDIMPACTKGPVPRSRCMIASALADIEPSYYGIENEGVLEIREVEDGVFVIRVGKGSDVDELTYEMKVDDSGVAIILKGK